MVKVFFGKLCFVEVQRHMRNELLHPVSMRVRLTMLWNE